MLRFYTLPPRNVLHPYVLVNANNFEPGFNYIRRWGKRVKSVILDSGVEIFRNPKVFDYPPKIFPKLAGHYGLLKEMICEVYATVPDYPDDYHPKSLWINDGTTNVERTVENVEYALNHYENVNWLIPIQGWNKQPKSVLRCLELYEKLGIKKDYYGVANLCVERLDRMIIQSVRHVKGFLGNVKLHVFGLKLPVALKLRGEIYSFDSMAWTRPVKRRGPGHSCKNREEREKYFKMWIKRLE